MRQALRILLAVVLFSSFSAVFGTCSVLAEGAAENASQHAAALRVGVPEDALFAASTRQRHIVLLTPVAPRSMPTDVVDEMKARVRSDFHVPLNDTLLAVTYADEEEVQQAMEIIYHGEGTLSERLRAAAKATDADYIAGFVVTEYREATYRNWKEDLVLHSSVGLRLIGYDRTRDYVVDFPASRSYHSEYSRSGTARILALFEIDRLMDKAEFRSTLFPVTAWLDQPRATGDGAE